MRIGVGALCGTYTGTVALVDLDEPSSGSIQASAQGPQGGFETLARLTLAHEEGGTALAYEEGGTALAYEADVAVSGPVAGVGQRMLAAVAWLAFLLGRSTRA
jgi:uncharacterized protein